MSYDRYEDDYHLTPTGWKLGTSYFYGNPQKEVEPPPDRVLTGVREVRQSSGWSPEDISWHEKWRSPAVTQQEINELIRRFGERPPEADKAEFSKWLNASFSKM
jgi:hypothetical protein